MDNTRKTAPGMTVIFIPNLDDIALKTNQNDTNRIAGIITRVWSPTYVNLRVFPDGGTTQDRTSVHHISEAGNKKGYLWHFPDEEFEPNEEKPSKEVNTDEVQA